MEEVGGPKYTMQVNSFINERMDIARVTKSGQSYKMSEFVHLGLPAPAEEMGSGGENFVKRVDTLFTEMLNADHISGHNLMFDITKLDSTLESLDAYSMNEELLTKRNRIFERINSEQDYFIDTAETMRSYLRNKASSVYGLGDERADNIVNQLLSPEFKATRKAAPVSMENITLNTNLLNLLEQEAVGGDSEAKNIMRNISQGSHVADVDVALQAAADRYRRQGTLDFRFDPTNNAVIGDPISEFEKYARNKVFRSQAMNPLTSIASVQHLSDASFNYITTQDSGMQGVRIIATRRDLGLAGDLDSEGILEYNKSKRAFTYRNFAGNAADDVDEQVAKTYITRTLNQAKADGDGTQTTIRVGSSNLRVTRNFADEKILDTGLVHLQDTAVTQGLLAKQAVAGIGQEAGDDLLIRSLGLTNEQFAKPKTYSSIMNRIRTGFARSSVTDIRNPLSSSDDTIRAYHANAARAGLPFNSLNVQNRAFSVGLAEATHSVAMAARSTATYGANADLTTELGLSFFNMQKNRVMGSVDSSGDLLTPSRVMTPFNALFDVSQNTAADRISDQILSVKAFGSTAGPGPDIMATDLNRFTMSFVSGSGEEGSKLAASRVNLVWGANQAFDETQSRQLASFMMDNANEFLDTVSSIKSVDADLAEEIQNLQQLKTSTGITSDRDRVTTRLAEHIRERGIVVGYVEGEAAEGIREVALRQGADITGNDRFFANFMMRLGFADKEAGILAMSAISDVTADAVIGRTSEVAQRETAEAVRGLDRLSKIFEDPAKRRAARKVVMDARDASALDRITDLSKRAARDFGTPMTDFYLKNKKPIGLTGLGLAAAGIGYYMYKKDREKKLYNEAVEPMPPEPASSRTRQIEPSPLAQSTRRDPLVTAGVVGNLDRNKIGHSKMGPNKYNHLYGG